MSLTGARATSRSWAGRLRFGVPLLVALALLPKAARAGEPDDATRASALQLADEAFADFEHGSFEAALEKYKRADDLMHLPAVGVRIARCLDKLGRLIEASERYRAVTLMETGPDPRGKQAEAKAQAEEERKALLPRIPSVVIEIAGGAKGAMVTLDGVAIPEALIGVNRLVDPGSHKVTAERDGASTDRTFTAKEGETVTVPLDLAASKSAPAKPSSVSASTAPSAASNGQRAAGFAVGGVGLVGVVVGGVTGGLALSKKSTINANCADTTPGKAVCNAKGKAAADGAKTLGVASTVGIIAGLATAGIGVVLLATAPHKHAASPSISASVVAGTGGATLAVSGAF